MLETPLTLVLDTSQLVLDHEQYDSLFRFYPQGIRSLIASVYCEEAKYAQAHTLHYDQHLQALLERIGEDYHDALAVELEFHNAQARSYMQEYAQKDWRVINHVARHIAKTAKQEWRKLFPDWRCQPVPASVRWLHQDLVLTVSDATPRECDDFEERL